MKNLFFVLIALAAGFVGAYVYDNRELILGATTARTTITNPWTFSATTTMSSNLIVTTANTATSSIQVGCWQFYATSTATANRYLASTTPGVMYSEYGKCPKI